jgi:hypothetical protein
MEPNCVANVLYDLPMHAVTQNEVQCAQEIVNELLSSTPYILADRTRDASYCAILSAVIFNRSVGTKKVDLRRCRNLSSPVELFSCVANTTTTFRDSYAFAIAYIHNHFHDGPRAEIPAFTHHSTRYALGI